jgi:hypothetical protein
MKNTNQQEREQWERQFDKTAFAKSGGSCFECCDYEGMYRELKEFIGNLITETRKETIKSVLPEKLEVKELPEKILGNFENLNLALKEISKESKNSCRQEIIDNLKSNYNIDLE